MGDSRVLLFYRVGVAALSLVVVLLGLVVVSLLAVVGDVAPAVLQESPQGVPPGTPVGTGAVSPPEPPRPAPGVADPAKTVAGLASIAVADLGARVEVIQREKARSSDISETFYRSPHATVHMHVIGFEQTCPLHIHRVTEEMTAVISGAPAVSWIYGDGAGGLTRRDATQRPGALIHSPPFCGHKWVNASTTQMQGNLVFASPPFDGNFYVEADDARMKRGGEPSEIDPDEKLAAFVASGQGQGLEVLAGMQGKMSSLLVRERFSLAAFESEQIAYVARGKGRFKADVTAPVASNHLAVIQPGVAVEVEADEPMLIYVFKPALGVAEPAPEVDGAPGGESPEVGH